MEVLFWSSRAWVAKAAMLTLMTLAVPNMVSANEGVIDPDLFDQASMLEPHKIVDCVLTNGDEAQCYEFVISFLPQGLTTGPFCPATVEDVGGIWVWSGEDAGLYRLDGDFWSFMDRLGYNFTDDEGNVRIQDPGQGGPPPNRSTTNSANFCLEASPDHSIKAHVQIPIIPVVLDEPQQLGTVAFLGLALDTVPIFGDAPTVIDTGNLPAIDPCGGHFDPSGYYHWHEVATDIDTVLEGSSVDVECHIPQSASALFAYAYDGYPIYGSAEADGSKPRDLDQCNGHFGPTAEYPDGVYHYHASDEAHNLPPCLTGATSTKSFQTNALFGAGSAHSHGRPPPGARQ